MRLKDKIAIVAGAAQGIGRAAAERFAQEGAVAVVVDLDRAGGEATVGNIMASGGKGHFVAADVSSKADVDALVAEVISRFGRIDVLMNNAAITSVTPFLDVTEDEFDTVIRNNLKSVFLCGQAVARDMVRRGIAGAIINMSSITALLATPTQAAYGSSKGGINSLTKVMAVALAEHGIRVNAIGPGTILTNLARAVVLADDTSRRRTLSRIPLRRCGEPKEVASIAAFLASDDASYLTGQTIYPDGGRLSLNYTVPVDD
jgi:NAD(P)-dependent dehydrogenase (short-subunit alcohol dehydrogenase family)